MSVKNDENLISAPKSMAWLLVIAGAIGWYGSFMLTLDRLKVLADPTTALGCDIASFISCKSVMLSWQAKIFGFPNPLIGIAAFVAPIAVGVAILAGAKFKPWFWQTFLAGTFLGFVFVLWLFDQAVFSIGALCPWCMVAWTGMIPVFWSTLLLGTREGFVPVPTRSINFFVAAFDYKWLFIIATYLGIALIIAVKFWSLWLQFFATL